MNNQKNKIDISKNIATTQYLPPATFNTHHPCTQPPTSAMSGSFAWKIAYMSQLERNWTCSACRKQHRFSRPSHSPWLAQSVLSLPHLRARDSDSIHTVS